MLTSSREAQRRNDKGNCAGNITDIRRRTIRGRFVTLAAAMPLLAALLLIISLSGCARQLRLEYEGGKETLANPFIERSSPTLTAFKGSGEVRISHAGKRASGKIDVSSKPGGFVKAYIYSPFGTAVASVEANDSSGTFKSGSERVDFTYDRYMYEIQLPVARNFTYGEFIGIISGGAPEVLKRLTDAPDTVVRKRSETVSVWFLDEFVVRVGTGNKGEPRSASVEYGARNEFVAVTISRFRNGVAREISIRDVDGNYITIKYDAVKIIDLE